MRVFAASTPFGASSFEGLQTIIGAKFFVPNVWDFPEKNWEIRVAEDWD